MREFTIVPVVDSEDSRTVLLCTDQAKPTTEGDMIPLLVRLVSLAYRAEHCEVKFSVEWRVNHGDNPLLMAPEPNTFVLGFTRRLEEDHQMVLCQVLTQQMVKKWPRLAALLDSRMFMLGMDSLVSLGASPTLMDMQVGVCRVQLVDNTPVDEYVESLGSLWYTV